MLFVFDVVMLIIRHSKEMVAVADNSVWKGCNSVKNLNDVQIFVESVNAVMQNKFELLCLLFLFIVSFMLILNFYSVVRYC